MPVYPWKASLPLVNGHVNPKVYCWEMDTRAASAEHGGMGRRPSRPLKLGAWIDYLGLRQVDIAKEAGIGESYLTQLKKNPRKRPSVEVLFAIATAMKFDNPNDLYEDPPPKSLTPSQAAAVSRQLRNAPSKSRR